MLEQLTEAIEASNSEGEAEDQNNREDFIEKLVSFHQIQQYFNPQSSNERLTITKNNQRVERREYYEIFPIATTFCASSICSFLSIRILPLAGFHLSYDVSVGLLSESLYLNDFNLIDHIGGSDATIGIRLTKKANSFRGGGEISSEGKTVTRLSSLTLDTADVLSVLVTPRLDDSYDITASVGECHFFHNFEYLGSALSESGALSLQENRFFGVILSPNTSFDILQPDEIISIVGCSSTSYVVRELLNRVISVRSKEDDDLLPSSPLTTTHVTPPTNSISEAKETQRSEVLAEKDQMIMSQSDEKDSKSDERHQSKPPPPVPSFFPKQSPVNQLEWNRPKTSQSKKNAVNPSTEESLTCCICLAAQKTVLLMPCKHLCLCENCAEEKVSSLSSFSMNSSTRTPVMWKIEFCPICRSKIHHRMKVFL
eukprot:gene7547-8149_t